MGSLVSSPSKWTKFHAILNRHNSRIIYCTTLTNTVQLGATDRLTTIDTALDKAFTSQDCKCCVCAKNHVTFDLIFVFNQGSMCYSCYTIGCLVFLIDRSILVQLLTPLKEIACHIISMLKDVMPQDRFVLYNGSSRTLSSYNRDNRNLYIDGIYSIHDDLMRVRKKFNPPLKLPERIYINIDTVNKQRTLFTWPLDDDNDIVMYEDGGVYITCTLPIRMCPHKLEHKSVYKALFHIRTCMIYDK